MSQFLQRVMNLATVPLDYPTRELHNVYGTRKMMGQIPAVVYQTWVSKRLTRRFHNSATVFREQNPELSFVLFDDSDADSYMSTYWSHRDIYSIYRDAQFGPMKADIFRYCILHERGGFYFDLSKGLRRPVSEFIGPHTQELLTSEGNRHLLSVPPTVKGRLTLPDNLFVQWGFGFSPEHQVLDQVLASIEKNQSKFRDKVFQFPKGAILEFTGPIAFTKAIWKFLEQNETRELNQQGVDFLGSGELSLKGSGGRYRQSANYIFAKPGKILCATDA